MTEVRVGVFVCYCGSNIGGVVDVPAVVEYARTLPRVACVDDNLYTCSDAGLSAIRGKILDQRLNRVVVASCTPRTHEELFRKTCEEAGLNRYLFEFVNLREHCSWIHIQAPGEATAKAKELVRMGVSKAVHLRPLEMTRAKVKPSCLVIGGGPAGLSAAANLSRQGFEIHLVEREERLGGNTRRLFKLLPGDRLAESVTASLIEGVTDNPNVTIHLSSTVEKVSGFIGAFEADLATPSRRTKVAVGTIIVATGARLLEPEGLYRLGQVDGVISQFDLEKSLKEDRDVAPDAVFINCAGARGPDRTYCGRMCCAISIKNARLLKEQHPQATVTVLQRDVMALGSTFETEYIKARKAGVRFIRFDPERPPVVEGKTSVEGVRVYHQLYGEEVVLPARTVVLTTPLVARDEAPELSKMLKVPLDRDGFFLEAHVKLRPVEFATDGVYIAGAARFPANLSEAISQGTAAAAKAAAPMYRGEVLVEATTADSDPHLCSGCGGCEAICPFGAIQIAPDKSGRPVSDVNPVMCKGCGACVANCPCGAIEQQGFTDQQIHSMVTSLSFDDRHDEPLDIPGRRK